MLTVFVTVVLTAVLAEMSAKSLETSVWKLVTGKNFWPVVIELSVAGAICFVAKEHWRQLRLAPLFTFAYWEEHMSWGFFI